LLVIETIIIELLVVGILLVNVSHDVLTITRPYIYRERVCVKEREIER
jgi:hypothetical protein